MTIDYSSLRKLDLNLLLALDVLIEEVNVTNAAEKLNMSQSAMSYSLKRLRTLLDDPILIRSSRDMEATPYAREISIAVRRILNDIQNSLLKRKSFDPDTSQEDFRIAFSDYIEVVLGKSLLEKLTQHAPGMHIWISNADHAAALNDLDANRIDLLIDTDEHHKSWHFKQELYREELVYVINSEPDIDEMTLDEYLKRRCILVPMQDETQRLEEQDTMQQQLNRNVVWSTPHFMAIPFLLANGDYVSLLPKRLAQQCARLFGLQVLSPPAQVSDLKISMFWHQRNNNLAGHQWLRSQLIEVANTLQPST
ncbi:MAG: LysR family transcriptional regulator [Cyanobacteria bacterium P01_B01_bin.77]